MDQVWLGCLEVCCTRELKIMILIFSKLISLYFFRTMTDRC